MSNLEPVFFVQAPHLARKPAPATASSFAQALRACIAAPTERVLMTWNGVIITISVPEPIDQLLHELVPLLEALRDEPDGRFAFSVNEERQMSFSWKLSWSVGVLSIDSEWFHTPGGNQRVLNERARLSLPVEDFLREWKQPLRAVLEAMGDVRILPNEFEPPGPDMLTRLRRLEAALPCFGFLYEPDRGSP